MKNKETVNLKELEEFCKTQIETYTKQLEAIQLVKNINPNNNIIVTSPPYLGTDSLTTLKILDVPLVYDKAFPHKEKVYYALREIESGLNKDVVEKLGQLDSELNSNLKRLKRIVTQNLDLLRKDGYIVSTKIRKKLSRFSIK